MHTLGLDLYNASNITNPYMSSINFGTLAQDDVAFSMPFAFNPSSYFGYFDKDFMSSMVLFDQFLLNPLKFPCYNDVFTNFYNTKSNLPQLKDVYNESLANSLANIAEKNARRKNTTGLCFQGVRETFEAAGLSKGEIRGNSAYMAADMLANHNNFKEIQGVAKNQLRSLPAGCVIVWDRSFTHRHGHIAVTLGDGREASDKIRNNVALLNSNFRVFVPTGVNVNG